MGNVSQRFGTTNVALYFVTYKLFTYFLLWVAYFCDVGEKGCNAVALSRCEKEVRYSREPRISLPTILMLDTI
jgi:hypothetical protein